MAKYWQYGESLFQVPNREGQEHHQVLIVKVHAKYGL